MRICAEVEGASALGFVHRGISTTIEPSLGMPLAETSCDSCGLCISTCPTGAIVPKVQLPKPGPFKLTPVSSICPHCGVGCEVELNADREKDNQGPLPRWIVQSYSGNLCRKGSFEITSVPEQGPFIDSQNQNQRPSG